MWDRSFLTRDGTCSSCTGRGSLNHWPTREDPRGSSLQLASIESAPEASPTAQAQFKPVLLVSPLSSRGPSQSHSHAQGQEDIHATHWEATARSEGV